MSPERAAGLRPSRPGLPVPCPCLARLLGLVLLAGLSACGSPSPDAPRSGPTSGSADAVVAIPTGDASRAGLAAHAPAPQATSAAERRSPGVARVQPAPADPPPSDAQIIAGQAQRESRELWFAELRESPDATVRLQALELWAQQPGTGIDPLTFALVDEDEEVRARAEALWEQQLTQGTGSAVCGGACPAALP